MTLQEFWEKCNSRDFFVSGVIILVGFASFGLGRLSNTLPLSSAALGLLPLKQGGEAEGVLNPGGQIVASRTGAKYHFPWCAGAMAIAEKNKIYFASVEDARKAGYTPASNCKGLK